MIAPLSLEQARLSTYTNLHSRIMSLLYCVRNVQESSAVTEAVPRLVARHDALRARIIEHDDWGRAQVFLPAHVVPIVRPEQAAETALDDEARHFFGEPMEVLGASPLAIRLLQWGPRECLLMIKIHHLATDAASIDIVDRELRHLLRDGQGCQPTSLPPPLISFAEHVSRQHAAGDRLTARQRSYWRRLLEGVGPSRIPPPTDRAPRALVPPLAIRGEPLERLRQTARRAGGTLWALCLGAVALTLAAWSDQDEVVLLNAHNGRDRRAMDGLVGLVGPRLIYMRLQTHDGLTVADFVRSIMEQSVQSFRHSQAPYSDDRLRKLLGIAGPGSHPDGGVEFVCNFTLVPPEPAPDDAPGVLTIDRLAVPDAKRDLLSDEPTGTIPGRVAFHGRLDSSLLDIAIAYDSNDLQSVQARNILSDFDGVLGAMAGVGSAGRLGDVRRRRCSPLTLR